ncbi:MAG TPA: hypothetical protein VF869_04785 [Jatrophihabitantaceae bacterium]
MLRAPCRPARTADHASVNRHEAGAAGNVDLTEHAVALPVG